jgi:hypothetical protein
LATLVVQAKSAIKYAVNFPLAEIDPYLNDATTYNTVCRTWYFAKDADGLINWADPTIKKAKVNSRITIASKPFAEGA